MKYDYRSAKPDDPGRDESEKAMIIREQWMRIMGLSEDEIRERCDPIKYPGTISEEQAELDAMIALKKRINKRIAPMRWGGFRASIVQRQDCMGGDSRPAE